MRDRYARMKTTHEIAAKFGRDPLRQAREELERRRRVPGAAVPLELPSTDGPRAALEIEQAQREFASLLGVKVPEKERLQEQFLQAIGAQADPGSIPFWRAVLGYLVPRDGFKPRRDELALSALALLFAARGDLTALALLLETSRTAADPYTRGVAAQLAVLAHRSVPLGSDDDLDDEAPAYRPSAEVVAAVRAVALGKGFEARFLARRALEWAGLEALLDAPEGVFEFEVCPRHSREFRRVIELRSSQTLDDLRAAVLESLGWEHDHLYAFYFGKDEGLELPAPDDSEGELAGGIAVSIGALGLVPTTTFDFLYDFGDSNHFDVRLLSISEKTAPKAKYPRVTARAGKSPRQYGSDW